MMFVGWLLAQAVTADAPQPVRTITLQAQFEQATAALEAKNWEVALADFQAIDARPKISVRTRGMVKLREGFALLHLGRNGDALAFYRKGLAEVPEADPLLKGDRLDALRMVGAIERANYDYQAARQDFRNALALADDPSDRAQVLLDLAGVTMFDDGQTALALMDKAVQAAAALKLAPATDAAIRDMRGRVRLNQGDYTGALADLQVALKDVGGLTQKTDLNDVTIRSDLALAALKAKQTDKARQYLAMTGEGRLPDGPFAAPADTNVPPCGGEIGPDDVAVIEFGIADDGSVSFANPVYASRPGPMVIAFARAVYDWKWRESDVKTIPLFFRAVTRIELRCSKAAERPGDAMLLFPAFAKWLTDNDIPAPAEQAARAPTILQAELDGSKNGKPISRVPDLYALGISTVAEKADAEEALDEAAAIASQNHAPTAALTFVRIQRLTLDEDADYNGFVRYRTGLRALLSSSQVAADAQSVSVVRLMLAAPRRGAAASDAAQLLQEILDDRRLDARDPLRIGAMVRLSSLQAQQGDIAAARATYSHTGLDAQQCTLVDAQPAMHKTGVSSNDYPEDAIRWGIGGWTKIEFDVLPDGRTINRRAIMAYPPFVFGDPTVKAMESTRYTQTYRPDGAIGCNGASARFRYVMPH